MQILALEAIYGENFIGLNREDGLRSFQINVHIDVPDKLVIYTKIGSFDGEVGGTGSEAMAATNNSNGFFYSFEVQYLPPIADSAGDRRVISESISPYVNLRSILNYNDDKCIEKFCQNLHECCICLSESAGTSKF
ncbi:hypothetical protein MKW94_028029 [Papaver nudicaule]|uniref:Uncharacterized protein n=1 Tax=Papaver nudicaule TaxID=74823 RepID=A0AA41VFC2_PAPNU|nr:hypothetical protein [Papaver nudicaule]